MTGKKAKRVFWFTDSPWLVDSSEKLQGVLDHELDVRGRLQYGKRPTTLRALVKVTVTAELVKLPDKI